MEIIGINGNKFHGKDTVAGLISKFSTKTVVRLSFAEPIKKALSLIHVIPYSYFENSDLKEKPLEKWGNKTPRQLAQWLGTDVYRKQFDKEVWLKNMLYRIQEYENRDVIIVITDCRFNNEVEFVKNLGGKVWRVDASLRIFSNDSHESEDGVSECYIDRNIDNNGSYGELSAQVEGALRETSETCGLQTF